MPVYFGVVWMRPSLTAKRILMTSSGCRDRVAKTPPEMPAIKCSYLMWLNKSTLSFNMFVDGDDGVNFDVVVDIFLQCDDVDKFCT